MIDNHSEISFFVPGIPRPGGSKQPFINRKTGRMFVKEDCEKNPQWRTDVKVFALPVAPETPWLGPLALDVDFFFPRIKGHFGTGKKADILKATAPAHHTVKPDRTKILRALEDALTGLIWRDDAQIVDGRIRKFYVKEGEAPLPGARVTVRRLVDGKDGES